MSGKRQNQPYYQGNMSKRPESTSTAELPGQRDPLMCLVRRIHRNNPNKATEVCRLIDRHIFSLQTFLRSSGVALSRDIDSQFGKDPVQARELWHLLFETMRFPQYLFRDGAPFGVTTFDPHASNINQAPPVVDPPTSNANRSLPITLPVSEAPQLSVEEAEAFLHAIKQAFPPPSEVYRHMIAILCDLKKGNVDIDDVYDTVMFLLGNRDDLKNGFVRMLPFYRTRRERQAALALLIMPHRTEEKYIEQSKE